jgi:cyclohexanone monooxygenase
MPTEPKSSTPDYDAVVIGAGISGLYMLYLLREMGMTVRGVEASDQVGGVWNWNRYPGARVDSESETYGYFWNDALLQEFNWSERFAAQPEVLRYINRAADLMDIRKDYTFNARVAHADWDDDARIWRLGFADASMPQMTTRHLVTALGPLSAPQMPRVPGIDDFQGQSLHTGYWPRDPEGFGPAPLDFVGKRVGVIGTGSSGVQVIQELSKVAGELTVFQRSPNWCTPLGNGPISAREMEDIKAGYAEKIEFLDTTLAGFSHVFIDKSAHDVSPEEREATFEKLYKGPGFSLWLGNYKDILFDGAANDLVSDFVARKIRARVNDPAVADKLIPRDHGFGTRRVPLETRYFECYNQPNVKLVDLRDTPIEAITETGLRTTGGTYDLDVIIYATGFDAILGSWNRIDIRGRGGKLLREAWSDGVKTWMGLQVPDFPNFWMLVGPQNGATFCNIPRCSAIIVDWLEELFRQIMTSDAKVVEATPDAAERYTALCHKLLDLTLIGETKSWFTGINKNLDGRDRREALVWIGGNPKYREFCDKVAANGYDGFLFDGAPLAIPANREPQEV